MPETHRSGSRTTTALLSTLIALVLAATTLGMASPAGAGAIKAARVRYSAAIEPLAGYQAQTTCSPTAKPGVADFTRRLLRAFPSTRSLGIVRACSVGGRSEHKEGRAFDWAVNARSAKDRKIVARVTRWLLKTDKHGNRYAMARRLGIQYMIWDRRIWGAYAAGSGWRKYAGASPHSDHVHFSFTWAGARAKTSFWTGKPGNVVPAPPPDRRPRLPVPQPDTHPNLPLPTPAPTTTPRPTRPPATPRPTTPAPPPARPVPQPAAALLPGSPLEDETVTLDAVAGQVTTTGALQEGQQYVVEVAGTYRYGPDANQLADAECSRTATDSTWRRDRSVHPAQRYEDHLDVYLDGQDLWADADVDTGSNCDTRTHTYRDTVTATRTGRVTLAVWDPTPAEDNAGALTIRIIAVTPRADMQWQLPATAAAGVTSPGALEAGVTHLVTVTGTVDAGNGVTADAECSVASGEPAWQKTRSLLETAPAADHLDVLVDRRPVTFTAATDPDKDGCDTATNTYRYAIKPTTTAPVNLRVNDPAWTDNAGALTVRVQRVDPVSGTETVAVDTAADDVSTARNYPAGQTLRITATGTYRFATGVTADAECAATTADPTWRSTRSELYAEGRYLGDVTVNNRLPDWVTDSGERCDATGHAYSWTYTPPATGPLTLGVADLDRSDNEGTVTVTISPATSSPATSSPAS